MITAVNITDLAENYYAARQAKLKRKSHKEWNELDQKRKEAIYYEVKIFLDAIGNMGLSIVPVDMVKEQKSLRLVPVREIKRPTTYKPVFKRRR